VAEAGDLRIMLNTGGRLELSNPKLNLLVLADVVDFDPLAEVCKDVILGLVNHASELSNLGLKRLESNRVLGAQQ
jgi:hypothetical protein